jgi:shikimate dehydrogenase
LYADDLELEYAHSKFDVKAENLETVIKSLSAYGFAGVNITLPYKADVIQYLDDISPEAKAIGAVNTIKINDGKIEGYNTDAYGAQRAIEKAAGRKVHAGDIAIVFGTGGAARAVGWSLLEKGVNVTFVCREPGSRRTETIKRDFSGKVRFVSYNELTQEDMATCSLLCNATSAGMRPNNDETPIDLNHFKSLNLTGTIVFDAIFNPVITKLQTWAKARGATLAYGIDMMVYQGIMAFEYWTGKKVSEETAQKAIDILMKRS